MRNSKAYVVTVTAVKNFSTESESEKTRIVTVCHSPEDCMKVMLAEKRKISLRYQKSKKSIGLNQTFEGNNPVKWICDLDVYDGKKTTLYFIEALNVKEVI